MRPFLDLDPAGVALDHTRRLWREHEQYAAPGRVRLDEFTARTLTDDNTVWSARVRGDRVHESLVLFAQQVGSYFAGSRLAGDLVPFLDVDVPGREAVVWRSGGVWVELWAPTGTGDGETAAGAALAVSTGVPSGRLPFRRRPKSPAA
ncbi:hypothetical protein SUDANB145_07278 (plasmid) [Streptomyces sp. enrichment culture]|uniref:hypothetical protein n=1 Tax=Streptomyces sp. enrichment culture TaxID=1795815 RepID=UPI003F54AA05